MEKNMEAGLLITGGVIPEVLASYLQALIEHESSDPSMSSSCF
jgi:hypothetical protein